MRRGILLLILLCWSVTTLMAQQAIHFGEKEIYLEENVQRKIRGDKKNTSSLELGNPVGEKLNVVVQVNPEKVSYKALEDKGIQLRDYLGSNAYFAEIEPGSTPSDLQGTGIRAVAPIRSEWKLASLEAIPDWVQDGENLLMRLSWFATVSWEKIEALLKSQNVTFSNAIPEFRSVEIAAPRQVVESLATYEGVARITYTQAPQELYNQIGARMGGGATLSQARELGERGLTGEGVQIGIWDANVLAHLDYGNRVHRVEFNDQSKYSRHHGMHTTGTIVGSGLLNAKARGIAPKAEIWTHNFQKATNGKSTAQEILEAYRNHNIAISSHSYGARRAIFCGIERLLTYSSGIIDVNIDKLSFSYPTVTQVYAAGNEQNACASPWFHTMQYAKNVITVGAAQNSGAITSFSSFGPLYDGRISPTITAYGQHVYSTAGENTYAYMNGTSMSTPIVSGHLALLVQRYKQLHAGALPYNYFLKALIANTADDAGEVGPDYEFGFGNLNAIAAVKAMENNWYKLGIYKRGGSAQEFKIDVPAGVKELRVMLCWNDPVAEKEYDFKESPIVNNLDLSVVGSRKYLPLTLDAEKPDKPAVEKVNNVDNIEQVVVRDVTAGEYTITVSGIVKQEEEQPYSLVWYFDYKTPEIVAPLAGEKHKAGESVYLNTQNLKAPLTIDFSEDGGISYKTLGSDYTDRCEVVLPSKVKPTNNAQFRITDANSMVLFSPNFTVMGQPTGVLVMPKACSTKGWRVMCKKVNDAKSYKVYIANIATGEYSELGTFAPLLPTMPPMYDIPEGKFTPGVNVIAISAIAENGIEGLRSEGAIAATAGVKTFMLTDLPYTDAFYGNPLSYWNQDVVNPLSGMLPKAEEDLRPDVPGAHVLVWTAGFKPATKWNDPFTESRDNIGMLSSCKFDLSNLPENTKLKVLLRYKLTSKDASKPSMLRLLANNTPIADATGVTNIVGDDREHEAVWDLSQFVKEKGVTLSFEMAVQGFGSIATLYHTKFFVANETPDISIAWANDPEIKPSAKMGEQTISFMLKNNSALKLTDVPVAVAVDARTVYTKLVKELLPYQETVMSCTHNFASEAAHIYKVAVRTSYEGDAQEQNNTREFEVYNLGNVEPMPEAVRKQFGDKVQVKPGRAIATWKDKIGFVDGQGALKNYKLFENGAIQFKPNSKGNLVQATFSNYNLAPNDTLYVVTGALAKGIENIQSKDAQFYLVGKNTKPVSFYAESDAGLSFYFSGHNRETTAGWEAEIIETPLQDQWILEAVTAKQQTSTPSKYDLELTINNLTPVSYYSVVYHVLVGKKELRYVIPELKSGKNTYTVPQSITVKAPARVEGQVVLAIDGDNSNNSHDFEIVNDALWNGSISANNRLTIASLQMAGTKDSYTLPKSTHTLYFLEKELPLYLQSKNTMQLLLSQKATSEDLPAKVRVWIDFDDNGELDDTNESFEASLSADKSAIDVEFDLLNKSTAKAGKHRMRVMLAKDAEFASYKAGKEISMGTVADFTALVSEGKLPMEFELAVIGFNNFESKRDLADEIPVSVTIKNEGLAKINEVTLILKINDTEKEQKFSNLDLAPTKETQLTFTEKLKFAEVGKVYTVVVRLKEKDGLATNNKIEGKIAKLAPNTNDRYGLTFAGGEKESLFIPDFKLKKFEKMTVEGWWRLDKPQEAFLIDGKDFIVTSYEQGGTVPRNAIVLYSKNDGIYFSQTPVLKPGKWQHIAIGVGSGVTGLKLVGYVDDVKFTWVRLAPGSDYALSDIHLNKKLAGQNAMFRIWDNNIRTAEELKANKLKSVREADGKLPASCLCEYIYSEGKGELAAYKDNNFATITSASTNKWQKIEKLVTGVSSPTQTRPTEMVTGKEYKLYLPKEDALTGVKLDFEYEWPGVTVSQGGQVLSGAVDFSSAPDNKLTFKAELADFLGTNLVQEFTVQVVKDLSIACEIEQLDMLADKNSGLQSDIKLTKPAELVLLEGANKSATERIDPTQVKLQVAVSEGATLYYGKQKIELTSSKAEVVVDFSKAVLLRVIAANGHYSKSYSIKLAFAQTITWESTPLAKSFSSDIFKESATASSGLVVAYKSLNPDIIAINDKGELRTVGVGTTEIVATQMGNAMYSAAPEVKRTIEVSHAKMTIRPKPTTWALGERFPELEFEYDGLLYKGTEYLYTRAYEVMVNNTPWDGTTPLAIGEYVLAPKNYSGEYTKGTYKISCEKGKLIVKPSSKAVEIKFLCEDEKGVPLQGVAVNCDGFTYLTGADGIASVPLLPDQYTVSARKDGYLSATQDVEVSLATTITLKLPKLAYKVIYATTPEGYIAGQKEQTVAAGQATSQVTALAKDESYRFKQWDDGVKTLSRTDMVTEAKTFTAQFEPVTYTLTYALSEGGEFVTPETTWKQTVGKGANAQTVTVKAKTGYLFVGWDDNEQELSRTDNNVMNTKTLTALFMKPLKLPWMSHFDEQETAFTNWYAMKPAVGKGWETINYKRSDGTIVKCIGVITTSYNDPAKPHYTDLWLASPWYSLEGKESGSGIKLSFAYTMNYLDLQSPVKIEYQLEGGAWTFKQDVDLAFLGALQTKSVSLDAAALGTSKAIRFRLVINNKRDLNFFYDDMKVAFDPEPTTSSVIIRYYAGTNGKVKVEGSEALSSSVEVTTTTGVEGAAVTAVAEDGYQFIGWSDGVKANPRKDKEAKNVTANFKRKVKDYFTISYKAGANGTIQGIASQHLEMDSHTSPVTAQGNMGYTFSNWDDGSKQNPRTDFVKENKIYTANFVKAVTLSYLAEVGGKIVGERVQEIAAGNDGTEVEAVANQGYRFIGWSDGLNNAKRTDRNVTEDLTVSAKFENVNLVTITFVVEGKGTLNTTNYFLKDAQLRVLKGKKITLEAIPDDGYKLKSVMAGTMDITEAMEFEVTDDTTVTAIFEKETSVENSLLATLLVAPNPFSDVLRIVQNDSIAGLRYKLMDTRGNALLSGILQNRESSINTEALEAGLYLLRISTATGVNTTIKVVKE
ncbi:MAG: S8 family serine peptidase [Bacteroides sp.]